MMNDAINLSPSELAALHWRAERFISFCDDSFGEQEECWHCGGEGFTYDCIDGCCEDAEDGCELCARRCVECALRARDDARKDRVAILRALNVDLAIGWLFGKGRWREGLTRRDVLMQMHHERTRCDAFTAEERADSAAWVEGLI